MFRNVFNIKRRYSPAPVVRNGLVHFSWLRCTRAALVFSSSRASAEDARRSVWCLARAGRRPGPPGWHAEAGDAQAAHALAAWARRAEGSGRAGAPAGERAPPQGPPPRRALAARLRRGGAAPRLRWVPLPGAAPPAFVYPRQLPGSAPPPPPAGRPFGNVSASAGECNVAARFSNRNGRKRVKNAQDWLGFREASRLSRDFQEAFAIDCVRLPIHRFCFVRRTFAEVGVCVFVRVFGWSWGCSFLFRIM